MKQYQIIEKCFELVERDHGGCEDSACNLRAAMDNGYQQHAIYLWDSSGASCDEFDKIYRKLGPQFHRDAEKERALMCKEVDAVDCTYCSAVIWEPETFDYYCSSCGHVSKEKAGAK